MTAELSCQEVVELLTAYLDGALDPESRQRFEVHLAACDGCTTYLDQFRQTIRLLGELPVETLSEDVSQRLVAAFRDWSRPE